MDIRNDFVDAVGNTPLIKLRRASELTGCTILGKCEFMNPGHSVKDRIGLPIIEAFERDLWLESWDALRRSVVLRRRRALGGSACAEREQRLRDMDIDKVAFTGSTEVGRVLIRGAAETINSQAADLHERLQTLTNGDGPEVAIEAVDRFILGVQYHPEMAVPEDRQAQRHPVGDAHASKVEVAVAVHQVGQIALGGVAQHLGRVTLAQIAP